MVKNLPAMQETWILSPGQEYPLEKEMATHSSILAWRIPCPRGCKELDMTEWLSLSLSRTFLCYWDVKSGSSETKSNKDTKFFLRLWLPSHCKEPEYGWNCLLLSAPVCLLHLEERSLVALGDWLLHYFLLQISAMIFLLKFTLLWPCFLHLLLPMNSLENKQETNKQNAETLEIFTVQRETGIASLWCPISPPCHCCSHLVILLNVVFRTWRKIPHSRKAQFSQWACSSGSQIVASNVLWFLALHTHVPRTQLPSHCARDSHCSPTFTLLSIPQNHITFQSVKLKGCYYNLSPQTGFPK